MIKQGTAVIEGLDPGLLMHRFTEQGEEGAETRPVKLQDLPRREQAEQAAYRFPPPPGHDVGNLYMPGAAFARMLREAGGSHKQKGSRKSLKYIVPAAVVVTADAIPLHDADGDWLYAFEVDSRPVTIPATKGRIMRHRPRIDKWRLTVPFEVDTTVLDVETIHMLLEEGGRRIGIGDYRPEKGGPYGRFTIVSWDF